MIAAEIRNKEIAKEDTHEMIVPLDEQILLYSNSTADIAKDELNETEGLEVSEIPKPEKLKDVENEENTVTVGDCCKSSLVTYEPH